MAPAKHRAAITEIDRIVVDFWKSKGHTDTLGKVKDPAPKTLLGIESGSPAAAFLAAAVALAARCH